MGSVLNRVRLTLILEHTGFCPDAAAIVNTWFDTGARRHKYSDVRLGLMLLLGVDYGGIPTDKGATLATRFHSFVWGAIQFPQASEKLKNAAAVVDFCSREPGV